MESAAILEAADGATIRPRKLSDKEKAPTAKPKPEQLTFDSSSQGFQDRFQKVSDRFFIAFLYDSQSDEFSSIISRAEDGDEIAMSFERRRSFNISSCSKN